MAHKALQVQVVAADREVWSGDAINIIARTTEGDIGILPGHSPLIAVLVPCAVEIVTTDGRAETMAISGGFMSVADGHVWILSHEVTVGHEVTPQEAQRELDRLRKEVESGNATDEQVHRLRMLKAQLRASEKAGAGQ